MASNTDDHRQGMQSASLVCDDTGKGEEGNVCQLAASLGIVGKQFDQIATEQEKRLERTKGRFNLFTVLLDARDETRLHSRFLAHLLDPHGDCRGPHDCGTMFVESFLRAVAKVTAHDDSDVRLENLKTLKLDKQGNGTVRVEIQKSIGKYGQLDIFIDFPAWGAIAIENKIDAGEGDNQIARYAKYLKQEYSDKGRQALLLLLTKDGTVSTSAKGFESCYYRISYAKHILPWLTECLQQTSKYPNINHAIQQYCSVVRQLTQRSSVMEAEEMRKAVAALRENPGIIKYWTALEEAKEKLREECVRTFFKHLDHAIRKLNSGLGLTEPFRPESRSGSYCVADSRKNAAIYRRFQTVVLLEDDDVYVHIAKENSSELSPREAEAFAQLRVRMEQQRTSAGTDMEMAAPSEGWPAGRWWVASVDDWHKYLRDGPPDYVGEVAKKVIDYIGWANKEWRDEDWGTARAS